MKGIWMSYTASAIQEESRAGGQEERSKKLYNDNKKSKFLAKRTGISSPSLQGNSSSY